MASDLKRNSAPADAGAPVVVAQGDVFVCCRLLLSQAPLTLGGLGAAIVLIAWGDRAATGWNWAGAALLVGFASPFPILVLLCIAGYWWALPARVRYEVAGAEIRVYRGRRRVTTVSGDDFDEINVDGLLTIWRISTGYPTSKIPRAQLIHEDSSYISLPRVLLWGREGKKAFADALSDALAAGGSQVHVRRDPH